MRRFILYIFSVLLALGLFVGGFVLSNQETSVPPSARWLRIRDLLESPMGGAWLDLVDDYLSASGVREEVLRVLDPAAARAVRIQRQVQPQQNAEGRFVLTFPHTASGVGAGLQIASSVFLINNSGVQTRATVFLRDGQGQGMTVSTNQGESDTFEVDLAPGEAFRLRTEGEGVLSTGWIEVHADIPLAGSASFLTRRVSDGTVLSEVGIADSPRVEDAALFLDTTGGKNTGFAICNPSSEDTANLSLTLRDLDRNEVADRQLSLPPLNQMPEFVTETFDGVDLTNFKGFLQITSDAPVALVSLQTRGTLLTSLPTAPFIDIAEPDDDTPDLIFTRIADGLFGDLRFTTTLFFLNNTNLDAQLDVQIRDQSGEDLALSFGDVEGSSFSLNLPARSGLQLVSDGSVAPGAIGWIQVSSEVPVTGSAAFTLEDLSRDVVLSDVGVPSAQLADTVSLFAEVGGDLNTGVGVTNPSNSPLELRFRLFDDSAASSGAASSSREPAALFPAGAMSRPTDLLAKTTRILGPFEHQGLFVTELFPGVPQVAQGSLRGRVEIEAGIPDLSGALLRPPFAGLTLRSRGALLTSLPTASHLPLFDPRAYLVPATDLAESRPGVCIEYSQRSGELTVQEAEFSISGVTFDLEAAEGDVLGHYLLDASTDILFGSLFFQVDGEEILFSPLVNPINEGEANLFSGRARALAGGGIEITTTTDPTLIDSEQASLVVGEYRSEICFDAGILQMPTDGEIEFRQEFRSAPPFQFTDDLVVPLDGQDPLVASYRDFLTIQAPSVGPRIDQVDFVSSRNLPLLSTGDTLIVTGSGFPSEADDLEVLVHCQEEELSAWTVLSASPTEVRLRDRGRACRGDLELRTASGERSNLYRLGYRLTPEVRIGLDSEQPGGEASMSLEIRQQGEDLAFRLVRIRPSAGRFVTHGWEPGQAIGSLDFQIPALGAKDEFQWIVQSSSPQELVAHAVDPSDSEPDPQLILTIDGISQTMTLSLPEVGIPTSLPSLSSGLMVWDVPLFELPGEEVSTLHFEAEVESQPLRALDPATALGTRQEVDPLFELLEASREDEL